MCRLSVPDLSDEVRPYHNLRLRWVGKCANPGLGGIFAEGMGFGKAMHATRLLLLLTDQEKGRQKGRRASVPKSYPPSTMEKVSFVRASSSHGHAQKTAPGKHVWHIA